MIVCQAMIRYLSLIVLLLSVAAAETGVRRPDNIAALAGSSVVFRCTSSANNQTRWDYYRHGVNQPTTIFNGERIDWRVSSRFTVDAESCMRRQCDLTIRRVQPSDAGYFVCFEPSKSNRRSAALVVLETDPVCRVNASQPGNSAFLSDVVEVSCNVNFSGTWKPMFHCGPQGDDDFDAESTHVTRSGVAYRRLIAVTSVRNNTVLQCSMQYDRAVQPTATLPELTDSTVPPEYTWTWNSPPILITDDRLRSTQATPAVYDGTTGSAARKMTIPLMSSTEVKPTLGAVKNTAEASMSHGASKSPEVLYITMALIGLLAVCVFVIAGLVLVVAKRRREAARRSLPAVPRDSLQNSLSCASRRPPRAEGSYTHCQQDRPVSDAHYTTIDDSAVRPQSDNCGQDYQDIDELIRRPDPPDPYLTPVDYDFATAASTPRCGLPYDLIDTNQSDNGHIYVTPAAKPTPTKC